MNVKERYNFPMGHERWVELSQPIENWEIARQLREYLGDLSSSVDDGTDTIHVTLRGIGTTKTLMRDFQVLILGDAIVVVTEREADAATRVLADGFARLIASR
jgi:hypothetical protein